MPHEPGRRQPATVSGERLPTPAAGRDGGCVSGKEQEKMCSQGVVGVGVGVLL